MVLRLVPLMTIVGLAATAGGQPNNYDLSASSRFRVLDPGSGNALLVVERRFGFDSTYVELLSSDAEWNSTPLSAWRYGAPLYFLFDAAQLTSGPLISGLFPNQSISSLLHADNAGNILWSVTITGMANSQRRFVELFTHGDEFTAYSNADGFFSDTFYRLEGDADGVTWTGLEVSTNDGIPFRLYAGAETSTPGEHLMVGSRVNAGDGMAVAARIGPGQVPWMKAYDLGAPSQFEEATYVIQLANGDHLLVMTASEPSLTAGYAMRIDAQGDPIWTTKLTSGAGVFAGGAAELADGDLLIAVQSSTGIRRFVKLDNAGELVWARECVTCVGTVNDFTLTSGGQLVGTSSSTLMTFDADGEGCELQATTAIDAAPHTPTVIVLNATAFPAVLGANPVVTLPRMPVNTLAVSCTPANVPEHIDPAPLHVWPVPTDRHLYIEALLPGALVVVRDMAGREVARFPAQIPLDLGDLARGSYLVEVTGSPRRARIILH